MPASKYRKDAARKALFGGKNPSKRLPRKGKVDIEVSWKIKRGSPGARKTAQVLFPGRL